MKNVNKIICTTSLFLACFHVYIKPQDAIAIASEAPTTQDQEAPITLQAKSPLLQPIIDEKIGQKTRIGIVSQSQNQDQIEQPKDFLKTLLAWFEWIKNNPAYVEEQHIITLTDLIAKTSGQAIDEGTQNTIASMLVTVFNTRNQLSSQGKQIFKTIVNNQNQVKFLSQKQIEYIAKTMLPEMSPAPAPTLDLAQATAQKKPTPIDKKIVIKSPMQTIQKIPGSFAEDIKKAMDLKVASKIIKNLIELLTKTGTNKVDNASMTEFTKALNKLIEYSAKFDQNLRQSFIDLLEKAKDSNFSSQSQKPFIATLITSLKQPATPSSLAPQAPTTTQTAAAK